MKFWNSFSQDLFSVENFCIVYYNRIYENNHDYIKENAYEISHTF